MPTSCWAVLQPCTIIIIKKPFLQSPSLSCQPISGLMRPHRLEDWQLLLIKHLSAADNGRSASLARASAVPSAFCGRRNLIS